MESVLGTSFVDLSDSEPDADLRESLLVRDHVQSRGGHTTRVQGGPFDPAKPPGKVRVQSKNSHHCPSSQELEGRCFLADFASFS
jgi:hypothetical protein